MAEDAKALREKYGRWSKGKLRPADEWQPLYDQLVEVLPAVRVPVSRLLPDRRQCALCDTIYQKRVSDAETKGFDGWRRPLVLEGLPPPDSRYLYVVDGNHRAWAAILHGPSGLWLDAVFASCALRVASWMFGKALPPGAQELRKRIPHQAPCNGCEISR